MNAVRRGDDRAFETLYSRYQRRIAAYVFGMVKDYGRAEDITQEVFVAALRRMRQTERPIAFKPWVYEIAKNACIDAYRRGRRAEEVSFDADDRLSPGDYGRLVATGPGPDAAVDAKQDLDHLCGAFGGLSDTHHQILVMREFEGLTYKDIGERMGMSRPAVESTLFRARKRLGEEYDELASGARCLRIQAIIAGAEESRLGVRDQRKLARHISHCQPCRRLAALSGVDVPVPARTRVAEKIAAWLPIPAFLRFRRGGGGASHDGVASAAGGGWVLHAPVVADSLNSGWSKAAAGLAALLVAGAGVGVSTSGGSAASPGGGDRQAPAAQRVVHPSPAAASSSSSRASRAAGTGTRKRAVRGLAGATGTHRGTGAATRSAGTPATPRAGQAPAARRGNPPAGGSNPIAPASHTPSKDAVKKVVPNVPAKHVPIAGGPAGQAVQKTTDNVTQTVDQAGQGVTKTVDHAAQGVQQTLADPGNAVPHVTETVGGAVQDVGATAGSAVDNAGNAVGGVLHP